MMEDLPLWVKLLERGKRFEGLDKITVRYRLYDSLSYPPVGVRNKRYSQSVSNYFRQVKLPVARRLSIFLYLIVKVDFMVDYIVQRPVLYKICKPGLWVWSRYGPYMTTAS